MSYPRENTILVGSIGGSNAIATLLLPNQATVSLPSGQSGVVKGVGSERRWRVRFLHASFGSAAVPATPAVLAVTDGVVVFTFDVSDPLVLNNVDWQFAAGAEVSFTLAAGGTARVGHINVSAVSEG